MRALAPVTNLFKNKQHDSQEKILWVDPSSESKIDSSKTQSSPKVTSNIPTPAKIIIHRVESGDKLWWMDSDKSDQDQKSLPNQNFTPQITAVQESAPSLIKIPHVESGEIPWWLDENAEIPEGVDTYPNWVREDGTTADGRTIYKIRKYDSDETSWWLSNSDKTNTESSKNKLANVMDEDYLERHRIRHIDSGERAWWQNSSENIPGMVSDIIKYINYTGCYYIGVTNFREGFCKGK